MIEVCLVGWFVGWFVDWLVGWLIGRLVGWLIGWLVGWLVVACRWLSLQYLLSGGCGGKGTGKQYLLPPLLFIENSPKVLGTTSLWLCRRWLEDGSGYIIT